MVQGLICFLRIAISTLLQWGATSKLCILRLCKGKNNLRDRVFVLILALSGPHTPGIFPVRAKVMLWLFITRIAMQYDCLCCLQHTCYIYITQVTSDCFSIKKNQKKKNLLFYFIHHLPSTSNTFALRNLLTRYVLFSFQCAVSIHF